MSSPPADNHPLLILASTSRYRKSLLERLGLPFRAAAPGVDESPMPGEDARETAIRLAEAKARAVAAEYPDALIIGSDQVALLGARQLGKPLNHDNAVRQMQAMRGQCVTFYTALALFNAKTGKLQRAVAENRVHLRDYSDDEIEAYLLREQPYDCAGSAKSEGLGITMIARMEGDDPNALIGLPLILLTGMLRNEGVRFA